MEIDPRDADIPPELVEQRNKGIAQPITEELESINLGTNELPKIIKIGTTLSPSEKEQLVELLRENLEAFAWSYKDMPGVDTDIVQHRIPTNPDVKPVKQKLRRMKPEWALKIKEEVIKQIEAKFLKVVEYPEWLANIVPVPKKDGRVRMCVDFRDLNKACPKDDFPLPHIDVLVDSTAGHALLSFMDGFSGYNQIKMAPEDMEKTSFITQWGTYCYKVMPFGLKNAGATYQRAATTLLHDMIHKEVEVYVDDMIVKSKDREGHVAVLRKFFDRIIKYKLGLNPQKCAFGVTAGKLLGFMITQRGIEVDPSKIKAILEMPPPKNEKEIRGFLGRLQYISRFIAQLTTICEPVFKLLKKGEPKEWNEECQEAFEAIKRYLSNPPILVPPREGEPLLLYLIVIETAMGAMLAQYLEESRKENAIYYLSKKMTDYEVNYNAVEKTCVALVWASQKLRHYMLSFQVFLVSRMDPLKYLLEKPMLTYRTARWLMLLSEFEIKYVVQSSIKGRVISEHLAENPVSEGEGIEQGFPDEDILEIEKKPWKVYFDGAANKRGFGIGVLLISPDDAHTPLAMKLGFEATNNITEYEACILGLEAALELGVEELEVYGDSALIICQIRGEWKTRDEKLLPYHAYLEALTKDFNKIEFHYLSRVKNRFADALATLASMVEIPEGGNVRPLVIERRKEPVYCCSIQENRVTDGHPWFHDIQRFVEKREYPEGASKVDKHTLRRLATHYIMCGGRLYRRSYDGIYLKTLK